MTLSQAHTLASDHVTYFAEAYSKPHLVTLWADMPWPAKVELVCSPSEVSLAYALFNWCKAN